MCTFTLMFKIRTWCYFFRHVMQQCSKSRNSYRNFLDIYKMIYNKQNFAKNSRHCSEPCWKICFEHKMAILHVAGHKNLNRGYNLHLNAYQHLFYLLSINAKYTMSFLCITTSFGRRICSGCGTLAVWTFYFHSSLEMPHCPFRRLCRTVTCKYDHTPA